MKLNITILLILSLIIFVSCSKKTENKLVLSNHDAYAFPVDNGWEVTTSVMVKGFHQDTKNGKNFSQLGYTVDLVKADGDTVKSVAADDIEEENVEEFTDMEIEAQVVLDSTYTSGKCKIILNIEDKLSNNKISSAEELELE